jgi:translation initiation factor IF-2
MSEIKEIKLPRLLAAAKEFNVGMDTLVEFLANKGFNRADLTPSAKLSGDMYISLQQGFQGDKVAKNKADQIEIPKGAATEKKKRDEEDISFGKIEKKVAPIAKESPAVIPEPVVKAPEEIIPVKEIEKIEMPAVVSAEQEISKIEAPEIEGPKQVGKIDISNIDSSTRPKKSAKKKTAEEEKAEKKVVEKKTSDKKEAAKTVEVSAAKPVEIPEEPAAPVIENIKADKLEGPKILGKIELPVDSDTRPKPPSREEKRKRKRIPVDRKGDGQAPNNNPNFRGPNAAPSPFNRDNNRPPFNPNNRPQGTGQPFQGGQGQVNNRFNRPQGNRPPGAGGDRRGPARNDRNAKPEDKEIDQKQIQEKIRETQAKLSGSGGRGKSLKAKYRRAKREEAAESMGEMETDNKLQVTEFVTVSELANLMDVSFAEVISKCMSLGIMVSINQRLDAEVIELVSGEFGFEVEFTGVDEVEDEDEEDDEDDENNISRAPIVTIMGHVDHGKTSLLDYIRSANVVAGEAGGITQHIGAYQVTTATDKKITFLDTPGHEAFTAMRARGAKAADVAVIVIAADDAVMPQTKEAISHAQAAGLPMIFAINKIDKDGANSKKIYEQLAQMNILVEEWGGKYQSQEISAKQGLNVDKLLEKILLEAELLELKANPDREATGTIIEASLDKGRGYVATILVQNGTLEQGDLIVSGQFYGRVKAMFNERNQRSDEAPPSTPAQILGLNGAPQAGEKFKVFEDEAQAKEVATKRSQILREQGLRARKHITLDEIGRRLALGNFKELKIIIKGDVDGSVEALSDSLQKLSTPEVAVNVVHKAVGQISESDVLLATASDAIIVGFNVRPSLQANRLAENEGVQIKSYSIIYNAIEEVRSAMEGMLEPKVEEKEVANVEIREVYKFDKATVAGCYVLDGKIRRDSKIRLFRDGILLYPRQEGAYAELGSLKRFKDDAKDVAAGYECGLTIKNYTDINVSDTIVAYEEEEVKRTL